MLCSRFSSALRDASAMEWTTALEEFSQWLRAGNRTEGTIKTQCWWIRNLQGTHPRRSPVTITAGDVASWLASHDWAPVTRKSALASVRRFFYWMHLRGHRADDPTRSLLSIKTPRLKAR